MDMDMDMDMEWISIPTGCFAVGTAVEKTSTAVHAFVREVREARSDLDGIAGELQSLDRVLDLLKDDAANLPAGLAGSAPPLLRDCCTIVNELGHYVNVLNGPELSLADKRFRWMATRQHMAKLRWTLEGYKSALGLALDLVGITSTRIGTPGQTEEERQAAIDAFVLDPEARDELSRVLAEIRHLTTRYRGGVKPGSVAYSLQAYLDALQAQANDSAIVLGVDQCADENEAEARQSSSSSNGDTAPDSAIDVNDEPAFPAFKDEPHPQQQQQQQQPGSPPVPPARLHLPINEIDELLDELDELHDRAPTPPPKAPARMNSLRSSVMSPAFDRCFSPAPGSIADYGGSVYNCSRPPSSASRRPRPPLFDVPPRAPPVPGRHSSLRTLNHWTPPPPPPQQQQVTMEKLYCGPENVYSVRITAERSASVAPSTAATTASKKSNRVTRFFGHVRNALSDSANNQQNPTSSNSNSNNNNNSPPRRPSASNTTTSSNNTNTTHDENLSASPSSSSSSSPTAPVPTRRSSTRRLSLSIRNKLPLFRHDDHHRAVAEDDGDRDPDALTPLGPPGAVFGVALQKSMRLARGSARTRHSGSGTSTRDFPLCVWKSYTYIRTWGRGVEEPDIFGLEAEPAALRRLRDAFSRPPHYGGDFEYALPPSPGVGDGGGCSPADLDGPEPEYSVHDAAALILLFLAELPKPLVPEAVAKRWIALSRQASQPGTHATRHEQCIDFWEEALEGVRGAAARSLLKLLLNLWGAVADAAPANDMTAERLAGRVVRPLMQLPRGRYDTDFMLAIAFLIRKRSEYNILLAGETRKSNAAF